MFWLWFENFVGIFKDVLESRNKFLVFVWKKKVKDSDLSLG